jgi:transcriptional regulator with XRE-family HTH domain
MTDKQLIKKTGAQIKILRKQQKLTQLDLSVKADIPENSLQRIETGRINATVSTLLKISTALNIEFFELFVFEKEK